MPGAIGWAPALLPSRGGVIAHPEVQSRNSDSARCDWEIEEVAEAALLPVAPTLRTGKLDRPVKYRRFRRSNILAIREGTEGFRDPPQRSRHQGYVLRTLSDWTHRHSAAVRKRSRPRALPGAVRQDVWELPGRRGGGAAHRGRLAAGHGCAAEALGQQSQWNGEGARRRHQVAGATASRVRQVPEALGRHIQLSPDRGYDPH